MAGQAELSDTKRGLIEAAERLFALQGIAATTIRQINAAAGQKNQSAIHYHFGSKDAILDAIMELRVAPTNQRRAVLLEEVRAQAGDRPLSTPELVRVLCEPNIRRVMETPAPHFQARFVLQMRVDHDVWRRYERDHRTWALTELHAEMRRARPFLPREVARSRFRQIVNHSMISLAEIELAQERLGPRFSREEADFRIEEMLVALHAIVDAPVTPAAVASMQRARLMGSSPGDDGAGGAAEMRGSAPI